MSISVSLHLMGGDGGGCAVTEPWGAQGRGTARGDPGAAAPLTRPKAL